MNSIKSEIEKIKRISSEVKKFQLNELENLKESCDEMAQYIDRIFNDFNFLCVSAFK